MANRQKYRHFVSVLAFFCASTLRAQSLSDLEKDLLLEDSSASLPVEEEAATPPPSQQPRSSYQDSGSAGDLLEDISKEDQKSGDDYAYGDDDRKDVEKSALEKIDEAVSGPKQIPFDHILVVKNRYINKADRFEFAPITLGIQPADSFRKQLGVGFSLAYHLSEDFAIEMLHASFIANYRSPLEAAINKETNLGFRRSYDPIFSLGSAIWWAPFKGKSATIENVYHWEGYFLGGGGLSQAIVRPSENAAVKASFVGMAMFGGGARLYLNKRAVLRLELRDYYDFATGASHRVNILTGASVLFGED